MNTIEDYKDYTDEILKKYTKNINYDININKSILDYLIDKDDFFKCDSCKNVFVLEEKKIIFENYDYHKCIKYICNCCMIDYEEKNNDKYEKKENKKILIKLSSYVYDISTKYYKEIVKSKYVYNNIMKEIFNVFGFNKDVDYFKSLKNIKIMYLFIKENFNMNDLINNDIENYFFDCECCNDIFINNFKRIIINDGYYGISENDDFNFTLDDDGCINGIEGDDKINYKKYCSFCFKDIKKNKILKKLVNIKCREKLFSIYNNKDCVFFNKNKCVLVCWYEECENERGLNGFKSECKGCSRYICKECDIYGGECYTCYK